MGQVTQVARTVTKVTASHMPIDWSSSVLIPIKGQRARKLIKTMLSLRAALKKILKRFISSTPLYPDQPEIWIFGI
jgi:hypothetical protein